MNKSVKHTLVGILIGFLVVMLQMTILFGGFMAFRPYKERTEGYFRYIIVTDKMDNPSIFSKKCVAIIDFSPLGRQQEIIDIPREIGGTEVRYLGYHKMGIMTDNYRFETANLKKLYIHENIKSIYMFTFSNVTVEEVMLCAAKDPNLIDSRYISGAKKYVYKSVYESHRIYSVANIVFRINYLTEINDGYYSLDNIQEGETIPQPAKPEREGYEFTGWYTEADCENLWDFNISPEIKEGEEFRLYAGWRRL